MNGKLEKEKKRRKKERKKRAYMLKTLNFLLINSTSFKYIEHNIYRLFLVLVVLGILRVLVVN